MALFLVFFNGCRVPSENLHLKKVGEPRGSLCQVGCSKDFLFTLPLYFHLFESQDPFFWIFISPISGANPLQ